MNQKTPFVLDTTMVITAGLDDARADECRRALAPLPVLRVQLSEETTECVRAVRPRLVVLPSASVVHALPELLDTIAQAGATVVFVDQVAAGDTLSKVLARAIRSASAGK